MGVSLPLVACGTLRLEGSLGLNATVLRLISAEQRAHFSIPTWRVQNSRDLYALLSTQITAPFSWEEHVIQLRELHRPCAALESTTYETYETYDTYARVSAHFPNPSHGSIPQPS